MTKSLGQNIPNQYCCASLPTLGTEILANISSSQKMTCLPSIQSQPAQLRNQLSSRCPRTANSRMELCKGGRRAPCQALNRMATGKLLQNDSCKRAFIKPEVGINQCILGEEYQQGQPTTSTYHQYSGRAANWPLCARSLMV